jgi:hypothetical protein
MEEMEKGTGNGSLSISFRVKDRYRTLLERGAEEQDITVGEYARQLVHKQLDSEDVTRELREKFARQGEELSALSERVKALEETVQELTVVVAEQSHDE